MLPSFSTRLSGRAPKGVEVLLAQEVEYFVGEQGCETDASFFQALLKLPELDVHDAELMGCTFFSVSGVIFLFLAPFLLLAWQPKLIPKNCYNSWTIWLI